MAKKVWVSLPLVAAADATDAAVVGFTKGGSKKELEIEVAALIMKWLIDRHIPFGIDFESATVDRTAALEALPRRLQKALGFKASVTSENLGEAQQPEAVVGPDQGVVSVIEQIGTEESAEKSVAGTGDENPDDCTAPDDASHNAE